MCGPGNHDWKPVPRWRGRWRCKNCYAYAYRPADTPRSDSEKLRVYVCQHKECKRPAQVTRRRGPTGLRTKLKQWCFDHVPDWARHNAGSR